ncbi:hypothetical protein [Alkalicoccus chagannorensis]|uniref:hypothetical protein n=1 Tax=Alkalicoccus chagannorensis TaxID=427072 RepID=UPI00047DA408|nr:hypothetical protein [Alkalicoccus chagannorensis]
MERDRVKTTRWKRLSGAVFFVVAFMEGEGLLPLPGKENLNTGSDAASCFDQQVCSTRNVHSKKTFHERKTNSVDRKRLHLIR